MTRNLHALYVDEVALVIYPFRYDYLKGCFYV